VLCAAAVQADPYTGIVKVDSVEAVAGTSISVPVRLEKNNVPFSALTVPLKYSHPYLTLDSVSFVGSMLPNNWGSGKYADVAAKTVLISYIPPIMAPLPTINSTNGIIATLFFKVSASANPTIVPIDSLNFDSMLTESTHLTNRICISDNAGYAAGMYLPGFVMGAVKVLVPTGVDDDPSGLPTAFALAQNYPNPFNPVTVIDFALPKSGQVKLEVFNVLGQLVETLVDKSMPAGNHSVDFNASSKPSGVYFYRLTHQFGSQTRKMVILK
jgi:hypothetical protein